MDDRPLVEYCFTFRFWNAQPLHLHVYAYCFISALHIALDDMHHQRPGTPTDEITGIEHHFIRFFEQPEKEQD